MPDLAEIEAAAKSVRADLDFTAQIGGDILFSYRGVELRKADVETLLAALATERAEKDEMRETLRIAKEDIEASRHRAGLSLRRIERAINPAALALYLESVAVREAHKATGPQAESERETNVDD